MSNATLTTVITAAETTLETISGLTVYREPPENLTNFPCAMVYCRRGELNLMQGISRNIHRLTVDLVTNRQNIQQAATVVEPYVESVMQAFFADLSLSGVVDHIGIGPQEPHIAYELVAFEYAGTPVFGYRFTIPIKVHRNLT